MAGLPSVEFLNLNASSSRSFAQQSPSPAPSTTPTSDGIVGRIDDFSAFVTDLLFAGLGLLALLAIALFLVRAEKLRRTRQLILSNVTNASGFTDLDSRLQGLSQLIRVQLVRQTDLVDQRIRSSIRVTNLDPSVWEPGGMVLPRSAPDGTLSELVDSLKSFAGEKASPAIQLITDTLLRPKGTIVSLTLQRYGDSRKQVALTFEIQDIRGEEVPLPFTLHERAHSEGSLDQAAGRGALPSAGSTLFINGPPRADDGDEDLTTTLAYLRLGQHLAHPDVCLFQEANKYLRRGLHEDPTSEDLVHELGVALSRTEIQVAAKAAFHEARQLEQAGVTDLAIEVFSSMFRREDEAAIARRCWYEIFTTHHHDADPYRNLAVMYRHSLFLIDEARELLQTSISKGLSAVRDLLAAWNRQSARRLSSAGSIMIGLADFGSAQKILKQALVLEPNNQMIAYQLATLAGQLGSEDEEKARGHLLVGEAHEYAGDPAGARTHYMEALRTNPALEKANEGLRRTLTIDTSPESKYRALINPAVRWLSLQLALRRFLEHNLNQRRSLRWRTWTKTSTRELMEKTKQDEGLIWNFFSRLFQASARTFPGYALDFYQVAIEHAEKALTAIGNVYQPHETLADIYSLAAEEVSGDAKVTYVRKSLLQYDEALKRAKRLEDPAILPHTTRLLTIGRATVVLLLDDERLAKEAVLEVDSLISNGWEASDERSARLLLNLASWISIAIEKQVAHQDRQDARKLLAFALGRDVGDRNYWQTVERDSDLLHVADEGELRNLKFALESRPDRSTLPNLDGDAFAQAMAQVEKAAGWT